MFSLGLQGQIKCAIFSDWDAQYLCSLSFWNSKAKEKYLSFGNTLDYTVKKGLK
jgi:hypothetical protein